MLETLQWPIAAVQSLVEEGGPFVFCIYMAGVIMWGLVFERYWYFSRILPKDAKAAIDAWQRRTDHRSWCARQIRMAMVSRVNYEMNQGILVMKVLVPLSPLLGLVGTVSGMLEVFDSMAIRGSADARAMASGVSMAMICTLSGLLVSITGLYPVHYFTSRIRRETELLADQLVY